MWGRWQAVPPPGGDGPGQAVPHPGCDGCASPHCGLGCGLGSDGCASPPVGWAVGEIETLPDLYSSEAPKSIR